MNGTGTVFIVDDAREVRNSLSRLLSVAGYAVRAFESAENFLQSQRANMPGCLLLDICLPGLNGIELQRRLLDSPCARPIVFLTGRGDIQTSVAAMKAGAVDFLTKPIEAQRLLAAVSQALRRDAELRLKRELQQAIEARSGRLTPREREVMACVVRGRLNKQIAAELGTGEKTIKVHRGRVTTKMGVRSLPELVWLASRVKVAMEPVLKDATTVSWTLNEQSCE
jgi:FixJ family two-component response regulator